MNQILIAPREAGKTTWLLNNIPKNTILVTREVLSAKKLKANELFDRITPDYLLDCFKNEQFLDWGIRPNDYSFYLFDEPSTYWDEFYKLWSCYLKDKPKKAAYTSLTVDQYDFNPALTVVNRVIRTINH